MEFFKKRAAKKAAKEKVKDAVRQADERVAKKRADKRDEALDQAIEKQEAVSPPQENLSAKEQSSQATVDALREALKDDPDKRIHVTAQTTVAAVFSVLKDERGVRVEDALSVLGAFAGHMSICAAMNVSSTENEQQLTVLGLSNGETAICGPAIYDFLIGNPRSVFNLVGGGVQMAGAANMPDPNLLVQTHVRTIGTESYGIPVVPETHKLRDTPRNFLMHLWPVLEAHITVFDKAPDALCIAMGVAAQDVIVQGKDAINPELAAEIVMQSAFATSSIPPAIARKEMDEALKARAQLPTPEDSPEPSS